MQMKEVAPLSKTHTWWSAPLVERPETELHALPLSFNSEGPGAPLSNREMLSAFQQMLQDAMAAQAGKFKEDVVTIKTSVDERVVQFE